MVNHAADISAPQAAHQEWHPVDLFINPCLLAVKAVLDFGDPDERTLQALCGKCLTENYGTGVNWLEFHVSPEYAVAFSRRLSETASDISEWPYELFNRNRSEYARRLKWWMIRNELIRFHNWLQEIRLHCRVAVVLDPLIFHPGFQPTERQREMIEALAGSKKTQFELMTELFIGSKETFTGKGGRGGMKELIKLGLVAKDEYKNGGYFLPYAPPK